MFKPVDHACWPKLLTGLIALGCFVGCATTKSAWFTSDQLRQVVEGQTTKEEVISRFGRPSVAELSTDLKERIIYQSKARARRWRYVIPVYGWALMMAEAKIPNQQTTFIINQNGHVEKYAVTETDFVPRTAGGGTATYRSEPVPNFVPANSQVGSYKANHWDDLSNR